MEPYNFENNIKNKLEKRTIQPSTDSWVKLERSLQQKEHKKNTKFLWIMGVAASVFGILFMASIFLKEDVELNTPIIVTSPEIDKGKTIEVVPDGIEKKNIELESFIATTDKTNSLKPSSKKRKIETTVFMDELAVRDNEAEKPNEVINLSIVSSEEHKIDSIISQIENLKKESKGITISDIDALLFKAQQEIALQRIYDESVKTVDAYKLLQDVEEDIDRSFRIKVLETLKLNYENMKTVIAQRND